MYDFAKRVTAAVLLLMSAAACGGGGGGGAAGILQFSSPTFTVGEDGSPVAAITVNRVGGADGAVSSTIVLSDGTATGGSPPLAPPADYDATPILVAFADGDATDKVVSVPIASDTDIEPNETVNLVLGSPMGGAAVGVITAAVLVIANDDSAGTFAFTAPTAAYGEAGAPVLALVLRRTLGSSGAVSVTITFASGTAMVGGGPGATAAPDLAAASMTVLFADQDAVDKTITAIGIIPDGAPERDETFTATITAVSAGSIGLPSAASVLVVDDDLQLVIPNPAPATNHRFGSAIVATAGRLAVGVPGTIVNGTAGAGVVRLFDVSATPPAVLATIANAFPFTARGKDFGASLAAAGPLLVIGAPIPFNVPSGAVRAVDALTLAFRWEVLAPTAAGEFGNTLAVTANSLVAGAPASQQTAAGCGLGNSGYVAFFDLLAATPGPTACGVQFDAQLGSSLAVLSDRVAVGVPQYQSGFAAHAGQVRVLDPASGATVLVVNNPFPLTHHHFGLASAAVGGDLAVSAPVFDFTFPDEGIVYIFDGTTGALKHTLHPPIPVANGHFGFHLAAVRDRLAIYQESTPTSAAGTIFVFDQNAVLIQTVDSPSLQAGSGFGVALAEYDGQLAVGAPMETVAGFTSTGQVYLVKVL